MMKLSRSIVAGFLAGSLVLAGACMSQEAERPWPAPVQGWEAPQPGEHPRLFFRRADLPAIRERAETPEGQQIVERLKFLLGGGEEMPTVFNQNEPVNTGARGPRELPPGAFTMSHAAGFAMLYQLTGEQKYADLARQCLERFFDGTPDRDERYTWTRPGAGLRVGPMMGVVALAYDLGYDGWDEEFRRRVVREIQDYQHVTVHGGGWEGGETGMTLERLAEPFYPPRSNHFPALVGGGGLALLAINGDPGADQQRIDGWMQQVHRNTARAMTEGFGDGGFFAEGPGPSHMAAHTIFVAYLQAMKVAGGQDYISPRPNAQWLTMRWAFEILPHNGRPIYPVRNPGAYGTEYIDRTGMSEGGKFSQGFGAILPEQGPALLWTYRNFVEPFETSGRYERWLREGQRSFDAMDYPHRAVLALINWPIDQEPTNPAEVLGHSYRDSIHGYYAFRNRWQDGDDQIVTAFLQAGPRGFIRVDGGPIKVWGLGLRTEFPERMTGEPVVYEDLGGGSGVVSARQGGAVRSLAVDMSGASGAPLLVAMAGPNVDAIDQIQDAEGRASARTQSLRVGQATYVIQTIARGEHPVPRAEGEGVRIGQRLLRFDGERLQME